MNKVLLIGRLTKDPELKTTRSGTSVCSFTLAIQRRFKNAEGEYEADFINCVAWRGTAEFICKHFQKGSQIGITGSIQTRSYEKDGSRIYITEVIADEAEFVGNKQGKTISQSTMGPEEGYGLPVPDGDDLPF